MDELTTEDLAILRRLFGPELPAEFLSECESAKAVEWADMTDSTMAINCLLLNVVHEGLGGGQCMGWGLQRSADGAQMSLSIYRLKQMADAA